MNAPVASAILSEVEQHLAEALALLDRHGLGAIAAPHIDLGLHYVRGEQDTTGAAAARLSR